MRYILIRISISNTKQQRSESLELFPRRLSRPSWSFHPSSLPTLEDIELSFIHLYSPRFPRVLINMISELRNSWSFLHSSLPIFEVLDLSLMDLCSLCFPRVLIYMIYEFWTSWSRDHSSLPTLEVLDLSFMNLCSSKIKLWIWCTNAGFSGKFIWYVNF